MTLSFLLQVQLMMTALHHVLIPSPALSSYELQTTTLSRQCHNRQFFWPNKSNLSKFSCNNNLWIWHSTCTNLSHPLTMSNFLLPIWCILCLLKTAPPFPSNGYIDAHSPQWHTTCNGWGSGQHNNWGTCLGHHTNIFHWALHGNTRYNPDTNFYPTLSPSQHQIT